MPRMVLGIDPGRAGGYCLMDEAGAVVTMKVHQDVVFFNEFLGAMAGSVMCRGGIMVFLEKAQSMPQNSAVSMFNYGQGFGEMIGVIVAHKIPYQLVTPARWTKTMLIGIKESTNPKLRNIIAAQRLFPRVDFRATSRCKKAHDGLCDAALIAEWGRRTLVGALE